jgi:hypothetical protein
MKSDASLEESRRRGEREWWHLRNAIDGRSRGLCNGGEKPLDDLILSFRQDIYPFKLTTAYRKENRCELHNVHDIHKDYAF